MTISLLLPDLRGGGAERVSVDLADALAALGYRVEFVLMRAEGEFLAEAQAEFSVVDLQAPRARQVVPSLVRYLRQARPTALLAAMWPLTVMAPIAARLAGFKGSVVVSEHNTLTIQYGSRSWLHRMIMRMTMRRCYPLADARIGVSRGVRDDLAGLAGLAPDRITVIHNPIRAMPPASGWARRQAEELWPATSKRILTVGSLKDQKNHPLLLQAFAQLPKGSASLLLLGQGRNEATLRRLAAKLGIDDHVVFGGFHTDPAPFYETADLFVLSSDYEGFGNVIVEALACGLPVVSTDCPSGPAEILGNGRYGRLTPVGDAKALAQAMQEALAAPVDREALKRRAADFSQQKAARQYLEAMGLA